jgi:hypothetical protein
LEIRVQPGWKKGTKVTFQDKGDQKPGRTPADIIFVIEEKPHPRLSREGNNLVHRQGTAAAQLRGQPGARQGTVPLRCCCDDELLHSELGQT